MCISNQGKATARDPTRLPVRILFFFRISAYPLPPLSFLDPTILFSSSHVSLLSPLGTMVATVHQYRAFVGAHTVSAFSRSLYFYVFIRYLFALAPTTSLVKICLVLTCLEHIPALLLLPAATTASRLHSKGAPRVVPRRVRPTVRRPLQSPVQVSLAPHKSSLFIYWKALKSHSTN